jgi:hypothetical protein
MSWKYKAEIKSVDERSNLPVNKELMMDEPNMIKNTIKDMLLNGGCEKVDVKVSLYDEDFDEWYVESERTHYGANAPLNDFMLICEGAHERIQPHSWCEARILHLKSKIIFLVNDGEITYSDELLEHPEVLFYRFKYTSILGEVYRFTLFCSLIGCGYSQERLAEIKETILKPGARWYCDHFREKYRFERNEDAMTRWSNRRR